MQGFNVFRTCVYTVALVRGENMDWLPPLALSERLRQAKYKERAGVG
jgi:hypothetical protein